MDPDIVFRGALTVTQPSRSGPDQVRFDVSGDLDLASADHLVRLVQPFAVPGGEIVLHLGGLQFIDSSGIRALLRISQTLAPDGLLTIDSPSPPVRKVLQVAGAERFPGFAIVEG